MLISKTVPDGFRSDAPKLAGKITGNIMIDALVLALAAVAMAVPAIITAATLGSKLEFDS
jgi:hypothetical protein